MVPPSFLPVHGYVQHIPRTHHRLVANHIPEVWELLIVRIVKVHLTEENIKKLRRPSCNDSSHYCSHCQIILVFPTRLLHSHLYLHFIVSPAVPFNLSVSKSVFDQGINESEQRRQQLQLHCAFSKKVFMAQALGSRDQTQIENHWFFHRCIPHLTNLNRGFAKAQEVFCSLNSSAASSHLASLQMPIYGMEQRTDLLLSPGSVCHTDGAQGKGRGIQTDQEETGYTSCNP